MIGLPPQNLSGGARARLRGWQQDVNAIPNYADRVAEAKRVWPLRNVRTNKTFGEVRGVLAQMASGHKRCAYCEDSCADEVEHIAPKDLFPELVFAWENYLFACGACNGEKRNNYAVFTDATSDTWADVKRKPNTPVMPPQSGYPVLINPRHEDPFHFLLLDLTGTFNFVIPPWLMPRERARARYTIDTLGRNARDLYIPRKNAFVLYVNTLHRYVILRDDAAAQDERDRCIAALQKSPHTTVWQEMKRWHVRFPGTLPPINTLFDAAPDALTW